jgi:hypothetical protein
MSDYQYMQFFVPESRSEGVSAFPIECRTSGSRENERAECTSARAATVSMLS